MLFVYIIATLFLVAFLYRVYYKLYWDELPQDYQPERSRDDTELLLDLAAYPNLGLYHRKFPSLDELANMTQKEQAVYATVLPRKYGLNTLFLDKLYEELRTVEYVRLTATTVGELAYLGQLHPKSRWSDLYAEMRSNLQKKDE